MISIIIPAFSTEPYLPHLLRDIEKYVTQRHEILVQREKGFGNAVLAGIKKSQGQTVVIMDADGSHNAKYIPKMVEKLFYADVVFGSRYVKGGYSTDTFLRKIVSMTFCKVARILLKLKMDDPMSGFIALKKQVFTELAINPIGYKIGLEIMVKGRGKLRILEYPIIFEKCKMEKSSIKLSNIKEALKTLHLMINLSE